MLCVLQVRAVVQMFTSRAELLEKSETTAEHSKNQKEEAERLDKDRANDSGRGGGLFGGLFEPKRMHPLRPLVDADDGVTRCPVCAWELDVDDTCGGCGWRYRPQDGSESEESDSSIDDDTPGYAWDESEFDEFGDLDDSYDSFWTGHDDGMRTSPESRVPPHLLVYDNDFAAIRGVLPGSWVGLPPVHSEETDGSEYDEEEDDDYDEMDSFIDDDENANHGSEETESDRDTVVGSAPARHRPLASRGPSGFVESSEDSDEKDEEGEDVEGYGTENISASHWSSSPTRTVSSSIPEDEADDPDRVQAERGRRYSSSLLSSEDSAETSESPAEDEPQSSSPPQRPARTPWPTGSSARNAIPVDDSEDEQPVGPVRRGTQRRRARFSPYPW